MKPLCNKKVIIVMRHGERIDLVDRKKQRLKEYDPELTALGKKQAKEIGQRVLERCDKFDYINGEKYWLDFTSYALDNTSVLEMY